jgi:hypothetical protein
MIKKKEFIRKSALDKFFFFSPDFISIKYVMIRVVDLTTLEESRNCITRELKDFHL